MSTDRKSSISLPPVEQIGIIVKDVEKTVEYYEKVLGWGPFNISEVSLEGCLYRGKSTDVRLKMAFAQSGPIEIELIEVLEGESIHSEFLRERGEGIQHVRFTVNNLDEILAEWAKEGIEPVWQHSYPEAGISWAYVNTDQVGGVMTELFEIKPV
ncbi:MAG: VOC family protein [Chloroflexi bacterium]|nr:VOC family protein [Chloroflexota bacterium]